MSPVNLKAVTLTTFLFLCNVNTSRLRQDGCPFPVDIFKWIFLMKMHKFWLKFHRSLFLLTIFQHWFRYWLVAGQATRHYLNQWWLVYWCIYASLGLNELNGVLVGFGCNDIQLLPGQITSANHLLGCLCWKRIIHSWLPSLKMNTTDLFHHNRVHF